MGDRIAPQELESLSDCRDRQLRLLSGSWELVLAQPQAELEAAGVPRNPAALRMGGFQGTSFVVVHVEIKMITTLGVLLGSRWRCPDWCYFPCTRETHLFVQQLMTTHPALFRFSFASIRFGPAGSFSAPSGSTHRAQKRSAGDGSSGLGSSLHLSHLVLCSMGAMDSWRAKPCKNENAFHSVEDEHCLQVLVLPAQFGFWFAKALFLLVADFD